MKYDILILDHDDTSVDSTATIHYPAHLEVMRKIRPEIEPVDLEGWFSRNFDPGIMVYLKNDLNFTDEELEEEKRIWRLFTESREPHFYPDFIDLLRDFRKEGGRTAVISHSEVHVIENLYRKKAPDVLPDLIYGWDDDPLKRKPNPWPALEVLKNFEADPDRILMIDDLKPGIEMANGLGIHTAGAGWGHDIPEIRRYMEENTTVYCRSIEELKNFLDLN